MPVLPGNAMMTRKIGFLLLGLSLTGCAELTKVGSEIAVRAGVLTSSQATSIQRTTAAVERTFKDIGPEEEYYLGRSVSATLLSKYPASSNSLQNRYLNLVGKTLLLTSDKPESYGNYHFQLLDSNEINAFAAPSGFIFVTKGMVSLCQNEDDLAAVLAHEISHVQNSHALRAIKTSRITSAFTIAGTEGLKSAVNNSILTGLTEQFEGSIDDMTQTLTNNGYGRGLESDADKTAVALLKKSGYNPAALLRVLEQLKAKSSSARGGFFATHPDTDERISDVSGWLEGEAATAVSVVRTNRFHSIFGRL